MEKRRPASWAAVRSCRASAICSKSDKRNFIKGYCVSLEQRRQREPELLPALRRGTADQTRLATPIPAYPAASSASALRATRTTSASIQHVTDRWGIPVLHIEARDSDNELNMAKTPRTPSKSGSMQAGWEIICKTDRVNPPGYSIHEVGTCRMGDDPKTSVLNKWCQSHDIKNLFVVDGASFVTSGWQNPTMTILALSMRASEHLAEQMRTKAI